MLVVRRELLNRGCGLDRVLGGLLSQASLSSPPAPAKVDPRARRHHNGGDRRVAAARDACRRRRRSMAFVGGARLQTTAAAAACRCCCCSGGGGGGGSLALVCEPLRAANSIAHIDRRANSATTAAAAAMAAVTRIVTRSSFASARSRGQELDTSEITLHARSTAATSDGSRLRAAACRRLCDGGSFWGGRVVGAVEVAVQVEVGARHESGAAAWE